MKIMISLKWIVCIVALVNLATDALPDEISNALEDMHGWTEEKPRAPLNKLEALTRSAETSPAQAKTLETSLVEFVASSNETLPSRQAVARLLGRIATDASASKLAPLLQDPVTADIALLALQPISGKRGKEVNDALAQALTHADPRVRIGALGALGYRRAEDAIAAIAPCLQDSDPQVALAAADVLGQIGSSEAISALESALPGQTGAVRQASAEAVLQYANRLLKERRNNLAAAVYVRYSTEQWPMPIRVAAFIGQIKTAGKDEASKYILAAIFGKDPQLRAAALSLTRTIDNNEQLAAVAATLPNLSPAEQIMLIAALGDRAAPSSAPPVIKAATEGEPEVRLTALRALASLGSASEVPLLVDAAASETGDTRAAARESLALLDAPGVDGALEAMLQKTSQPDARIIEAMRALADRGSPLGRDAIFRVVETGSENARAAGLKALLELATVADVKRLVEIATVLPPEASRAGVVGVLEAAVRKSFESSNPQTLIEYYRPESPPAVKTLILAVLGRLGGEVSLNLTREALKDSDNEVRQAAIRALADWPDSSALESLIALAQEQGSRARTLRGFIRLVRADPKRNEAETVALYRQAWPLAGTDERQMILSGLGDLKGPEALVMAAEGLDDSAVKTEAIASVLRIARAAASNYPADVRKTIERLLKTSLDPKIKAEGEAILSSLP